MRPIYYLNPLLVVVGWVLSGCVPASSITIPTPTFFQSTPTSIVIPIESATLTPLATLQSEQAQETIKTLLQEPVDCPAPCFWGIIPERTTLDEAKNIFAHLDLPIWHNTLDNRELYGVEYKFDNGLLISPILTIQNEVVESLRIKLHPEEEQAEVSRKWLTYSPEMLIERYGSPSKVSFFVGRGPNPLYLIDMYFDNVDLIIHYDSYEIYSDMQICPLTDQMNEVRIWLGKNPMYPPNYYDAEVVPLEEATTLTMEEFSNLITGDPSKACFTLNSNAFP